MNEKVLVVTGFKVEAAAAFEVLLRNYAGVTAVRIVQGRAVPFAYINFEQKEQVNKSSSYNYKL